MGITAAEVLKLLAKDKEYQARTLEHDKKFEALEKMYKADEKAMLNELKEAGFLVNSVWDFVNSDNYYFAATPVLVRHLDVPHHPRILSGILRALAMPELSGNIELWDRIAEIYKQVRPDRNVSVPEERGLQEAAAIALEVLTTRNRLEDLKKLIRENSDADGIDWLEERERTIKQSN